MATLVTITGTFRDAGQNLAPAGSTITVRPTAPILDTDGQLIVSQLPYVITLASGAIPANTKLYATDDPTSQPENVMYEFTVAIEGAKPYKFRAPLSYTDTTVDLTSVIEPEPQPSFFGYATSADFSELTLLFLALCAANLESVIVGTITRDANEAVVTADVVWLDGTPGVFTSTVRSTLFPGAVDAYTITYGSPAVRTYTQPELTRNRSGSVIYRPPVTVS